MWRCVSGSEFPDVSNVAPWSSKVEDYEFKLKTSGKV